MTIVCPCCRRALPEFDALITAKVAEMREHCNALSIEITWDGFIRDTAVAEHFLRISPGTLRNRRYGDRPIPLRKCGGHDEYSLSAIAAELIDDLHESAL